VRPPRPVTARQYVVSLGLWAVAWVIVAAAGVALGTENIWAWDAWDKVWAVLEIRLYTVMTARIVGASLGLAGLALQALLRNPLADPYILGVSGGASLGVILSSFFSILLAPVFGFLGALVTVGVVYAVAQRRGRLEPYTLLLSGVILNAFYGAAIMLVVAMASPVDRGSIAYWMMGSIGTFDPRGAPVVAVVGGLTVAAAVVFALAAKGFNLVVVGEDTAGALGVRVDRLRLVAFVVASLVTGASVALVGPIGFVGLICPHLLRLVIGPDHRRLVPATFFFGAIFLVAADLVTRLLASVGDQAPPVGVLTAMCGGPFFIYLLRTRWRRAAEVR